MPADAYARELLLAEIPLRIILSLDNLFVLLYTGAFLLLASAVFRKRSRFVTYGATLLLFATGVLDLVENHHIQTMLDSARLNIPVLQTEISERARYSMLKFHCSYLGLFLFSFVLPKDTFLERLLRWGIRLILVPSGILLYTVTGQAGQVFMLVRYAGMILGFGALSYNYFLRSRGRHLYNE